MSKLNLVAIPNVIFCCYLKGAGPKRHSEGDLHFLYGVALKIPQCSCIDLMQNSFPNLFFGDLSVRSSAVNSCSRFGSDEILSVRLSGDLK